MRNMGELTFSGAAVSLRAAEDEAGFIADNTGPWPTLVNGEGAQIVVEAATAVGLEWLLWNEGGSVVVRMRNLIGAEIKSLLRFVVWRGLAWRGQDRERVGALSARRLVYQVWRSYRHLNKRRHSGTFLHTT